MEHPNDGCYRISTRQTVALLASAYQFALLGAVWFVPHGEPFRRDVAEATERAQICFLALGTLVGMPLLACTYHQLARFRWGLPVLQWLLPVRGRRVGYLVSVLMVAAYGGAAAWLGGFEVFLGLWMWWGVLLVPTAATRVDEVWN